MIAQLPTNCSQLPRVPQLPRVFHSASLFLFFSFSLFFFFPTIGIASPFLVCDIPPADQQVLGVRGSIDGTPFDTPHTVQHGALLIYDIGSLSPTRHTFTNIRFYNMRGESTSVPFDLPAVPSPPLNIGLRP